MHRLGVDIGGVIIDKVNDNTDTSLFGENYLQTTAVPNAFEALRDITAQKFGANVWLVSKCGPEVQRKTLEWLNHHDFYERTGILAENVLFTPVRIGKLAIAQELELTHFIDDRLEILGYLRKEVPNLYLFDPNVREVEEHRDLLDAVTVVPDWETQRELLLA